MFVLSITSDVTNINIFRSSSDEDSFDIAQRGSLLISNDGGVSWNTTLTNNANTSFIIRDVFYFIEDSVIRVLASTNKGVYGSHNDGFNWSVAFGDTLPQRPAVDLDVDLSTYKATIFVTSFNNNEKSAVFRSQDGGRTFQQVYVTPIVAKQIVGTKIDIHNKNKIYLLLSDGSFFVSYDKGSSWEQYSSISVNQSVVFTNFLLYPHNARTMFATTNKALYRSTNAGLSWQVVKSFTNNTIYSIHINDRYEDIYIGTENKIFHSRNRGTTFNQLKFLSTEIQSPLTTIFASTKDRNVLYVGSGTTLYRTINKGRSWSVTVFEQLNNAINFFSVNPANTQIQYIGSKK